MNAKSTLLAGALIGLSLSAFAGQPITLNDSQMDAATAGGGFDFDIDISKHFNIDEKISEHKDAKFDVHTHVDGQSAVAEGTAESTGPNSDAQVFNFTKTNDEGSFAAGKSISLRSSCGCK
jgi:hypothetical protein